jgi:hypothetical protein
MKTIAATKIFIMTLVLMHLHPGISRSDADMRDKQVMTQFTYHRGPGDSMEMARALSLFGAKHEAVLVSAEHLADKGLLKIYGEKRMEIFCLAAGELHSSIIEEWYCEKDNTYRTNIKYSVALSDFVRAEIRNSVLEKSELQFSLQQEMEPKVSPVIAPAEELSRAYRYLRKHQWRMAIIYLDHLEKKYSHWGTLFHAKAMAYLGMHETEKAFSALSSACHLGDQESCMEIKELDPSQ